MQCCTVSCPCSFPQPPPHAACCSHPAVPDRWPDQAQLTVYAAGVRAQLLAAVQQGVSGSTALPEYVVSTSGGSSSGAARVSMHALCMAVDHERQHQETLCYMLAQQRKADAAAAAAGRPAVLASQGSRAVVTSGNEVQPLPLESSAGTVLPFYLQQCSCMHALTSPTTSPAAAAPACAVAPVAPATPAKTERLPGRLGVLSLQDGATVEPAKSQQLGSSGCEEAGAGFVHIPGGEASRSNASSASRCYGQQGDTCVALPASWPSRQVTCAACLPSHTAPYLTMPPTHSPGVPGHRSCRRARLQLVLRAGQGGAAGRARPAGGLPASDCGTVQAVCV